MRRSRSGVGVYFAEAGLESESNISDSTKKSNISKFQESKMSKISVKNFKFEKFGISSKCLVYKFLIWYI